MGWTVLYIKEAGSLLELDEDTIAQRLVNNLYDHHESQIPDNIWEEKDDDPIKTFNLIWKYMVTLFSIL
jgi:hypothetical protein